jgi:hypothetical protein
LLGLAKRTNRGFALLFVTSLLSPACGSKKPGNRHAETEPVPARSSNEFDDLDTQRPFVFVFLTPALPGPKQEIKAGLIGAVWNDGTVVRAHSESEIGKAYLKGKLTPEQVIALRQFVVEVPLHGTSKPVVVDAAAEHLGLRLKHGVKSWAHSPPHTADPRITAIKERLLSLDLTESTEVMAKPYTSWPGDWFK